MTKIILIVAMLILANCTYASSSNIISTSLENEWRTGMSARGSDEVIATLKSTDTSKPSYDYNYNKTSISVGFILLTKNPNSKISCQNTPSSNDDRISVKINLGNNDQKNHNYTFDNSKAFLTSKSGTKYHLQATEHNSSIPMAYQKYNLTEKQVLRNGATIYSSNRNHYFKSPLLCMDLDGAIFELRGIYKNDQELPPLKFRIDYN